MVFPDQLKEFWLQNGVWKIRTYHVALDHLAGSLCDPEEPVEMSSAPVLKLGTFEEVEYVAPHRERWLSPQTVFELVQAIEKMMGDVKRTVGGEAVMVVRHSKYVGKVVPPAFSHGEREEDARNPETVDHCIEVKFTVVEVGIASTNKSR